MYSSIEETSRTEVIQNCYWPLLKLAETVPIGIEAPALTVGIINRLDSAWIEKLKKLIRSGKVEFIGSGYSQIIGPLVPAKVNDWNQKIGLDVYDKLLGVRPKVALVNEMAYSGGILEHYINNGYEAIIMEWNNPRKYHPEWKNEWRYYSQKAIGADGREFPLIWADSIAFQKFQRYAHGEISLNSYLKYLKAHQGSELRNFPLYANDAEVFDFRPGRFNTEVVQSQKESEWERVETLLEKLSKEDNIKFILPSTVLQGDESIAGMQKLSLESTAQPIPVKKQEKYNIIRWALTGRNDLRINTICYRFYIKILELNQKDYWKKLCYFWSSDFRTHITAHRWEMLLAKITAFADELGLHTDFTDNNSQSGVDNFNSLTNGSNNQRFKMINSSHYELMLDTFKGCAIHSFKSSEFIKPLMGTIDHGYFDDIEYGADFYTGHTVIEKLGKHKVSDLLKADPQIIEGKNSFTVKSKFLNEKIEFNNTLKIKKNLLTLTKQISLPVRDKQVIHPFHFTFLPEAWDKGSLYFATHNGGKYLETFPIRDTDFHHGENLSFLISAKHGLGSTQGITIIGDKDKRIVFSINQSQSFLIPSIFYKKVGEDKFLLRLVYSAQEIDETFKDAKSGANTINTSLKININSTSL